MTLHLVQSPSKALLVLALAATACDDDAALRPAAGAVADTPDAAVDGTDGGADAPLDGHSIRAELVVTPDEGGETATFLTPAVSPYTMPVTDIAGKPFYVAVFAGGFDQGVDLDLHHEWGTVPDDLHIRYVSPPRFPNGPYDVAIIVYTHTAITRAEREDFFAIVPTGGDLSAFTLSQDRILPGDPGFSNGVIRANVADADAEFRLDNHHDPNDIGAALTDTVMAVP